MGRVKEQAFLNIPWWYVRQRGNTPLVTLIKEPSYDLKFLYEIIHNVGWASLLPKAKVGTDMISKSLATMAFHSIP